MIKRVSPSRNRHDWLGVKTSFRSIQKCVNSFTASVSKISGLKHARTRLQIVYFSGPTNTSAPFPQDVSSDVSSTLLFDTALAFVWLTMTLSRPFKKTIERFFFPRPCPPLQAIDGMMSLALCPQLHSQAPQHLGFSEKQATRGGWLLSPSLSARSFPSTPVRPVVHPHEFSNVDAEHCMIVWVCHSIVKSVRVTACGVSLGSPVEGTCVCFHFRC